MLLNRSVFSETLVSFWQATKHVMISFLSNCRWILRTSRTGSECIGKSAFTCLWQLVCFNGWLFASASASVPRNMHRMSKTSSKERVYKLISDSIFFSVCCTTDIDNSLLISRYYNGLMVKNTDECRKSIYFKTENTQIKKTWPWLTNKISVG